MKVCHVSLGKIRYKTPAEWLKVTPYFARILTEMAKENQVFSFHFASATETILFQNVQYEFLKDSPLEMILLGRLASSVRHLNPDVIILHGFHSSLRVFRFVALLREFRIFVQHHGEKRFGFPKSVLQKLSDRFVIGYFFSNAEIGDEWVRAGLIKNSNKILEVLEVTSSFHIDKNQPVRSDKFNFIWVGRLDVNKDPGTLIEGFLSFLKAYPQANLYLIFNTDDLLAKVKIKIAGFHRNIHLVGAVPHIEMPKWYAKCDFIISTSLFEAGGVSVLEGMACGCVPILSDIPSFRKISADGHVGLLFSKGSATALTDALSKAADLNVLEERKRMLAHFENNLSPTAIANQIIKFTLRGFQKEKSSAL